jgi:hypothetical protein
MEINRVVGDVHIQLDTSRIDGNIKEAQAKLNGQIVADCEPLVPFRQGALRNSVFYPQGIHGGEIEYNTVYAHMIYAGIVYSPNIPIKDATGNITGWFSPPGKKKTPTDRKLQYHTPGTTDHFFDKAKETHLQEWIDLVKKEVGK